MQRGRSVPPDLALQVRVPSAFQGVMDIDLPSGTAEENFSIMFKVGGVSPNYFQIAFRRKDDYKIQCQ